MSVSPEPGVSCSIPHRITQCDIARAAGVHNTTVSLALRNSPTIPEATRKRIQTLAKEMGYHRDPALQALVAYRKGRVAADRRDTIAYITNWESRWGWQSLPADAHYYAGAMRKAAQFGYQLEHFWLGEPGMTARRLSSVLFHRGITGVLLASHRPGVDELGEFDWSRVSAVKIGCFPSRPSLHRVMGDQLGAIRTAMHKVRALGYERIGLVLPKIWDEAVDLAISTAFVLERNRLLPQHRVSIFYCGAPDADGRASEHDSARLQNWVRSQRPEVLLSSHSLLGERLGELGLVVPRDFGFVDVFAGHSDPCIAGVSQRDESVGEVAAEMLVGLMQQNVFGPAEVPTTTTVEGLWCDGASLPRYAQANACGMSDTNLAAGERPSRMRLHAAVTPAKARAEKEEACALSV